MGVYSPVYNSWTRLHNSVSIHDSFIDVNFMLMKKHGQGGISGLTREDRIRKSYPSSQVVFTGY